MSQASLAERSMLTLINQERAALRIDPLRLELRLNESSEDHSQWMNQTDTFSHTGAQGSSAGDRMTDAGFTFSGNWSWGENIAWQSERGASGILDDVADLHDGLMNSPGHRANILNPDFDLIGIGIELGNFNGWDSVMATQNFASTDAPVQIDTAAPTTSPLTGTSANDRLSGTDLNDLMSGNGGHDTVSGGAGNDTLNGDTGADRLSGGSGNDALSGGQGLDHIYGGQGHDLIKGQDGNDRLFGGSGNDTVTGGNGADRATGAKGSDSILGGPGNDSLIGGQGNDTLKGGDGNDRLNGSDGNDRMFGGGGKDKFVFSRGTDIVSDFQIDIDRIDLKNTFEINGFSDLTTENHIRQTGQDVVISDFAGNTMRLLDTTLSNLNADDFLF